MKQQAHETTHAICDTRTLSPTVAKGRGSVSVCATFWLNCVEYVEDAIFEVSFLEDALLGGCEDR